MSKHISGLHTTFTALRGFNAHRASSKPAIYRTNLYCLVNRIVARVFIFVFICGIQTKKMDEGGAELIDMPACTSIRACVYQLNYSSFINRVPNNL